MGDISRTFASLAKKIKDAATPDLNASTNGLNEGLKSVAVAVVDTVGIGDPIQAAKSEAGGAGSRTRQIKEVMKYN